MPAVPLPYTHGERVEVFVQLVQQTDALNDHVVRPCWVHFHLVNVRGKMWRPQQLLSYTTSIAVQRRGQISFFKAIVDNEMLKQVVD